MHVFVTGGTGLIGRSLVARLLARGDGVTVLTRDASAGRAKVPDAVTLIEGDPTVPGPWQEAASGADAVVNLAGEPIFAHRWSRRQKEVIRTSRVQSSQNVVEAIARGGRAGVTLVSASAIGYYGPRGDEELSEDVPAGSDFLARVAVERESAALSAADAGVRVVVMRIGIVLAREGGALQQMILPFRLHVGGCVASGRQWMSWIHIDDMVGVIAFALENLEVIGPVNATAPGPVTNREFARTLAEVLGRKSWLPAPGFALRIALGEVAGIVTTGQRVIPAKVQAAGYEFCYTTVADALRQILAT